MYRLILLINEIQRLTQTFVVSNNDENQLKQTCLWL